MAEPKSAGPQRFATIAKSVIGRTSSTPGRLGPNLAKRWREVDRA